MLAFFQANGALVFAVLFAIDQLLAAIPSIQSNSVFQLIGTILSMFAPKPPASLK